MSSILRLAQRTTRLLTIGRPQIKKSFTPQIRQFTTTNLLKTGDFEYEDPKSEDEVVNITYVLRDGTERKIRGKVGDNVMFLAHRYDIEMEGACEASLACSTCHVYVDPAFKDKLPEPLEEEDDMLDMVGN
ncbi:hypothetical protein CRE_20639 [Caenorhabditis remanei]|uniref:2Fe-2S ferredoxin-type domain-containing protein n=1 Tax=Caenorhabditis remanei TaxID=31234 RepID=E3NST3_CAERE|nr:hypothetical protein CRE_20639 [Caenorhabditis remanei]